VTNLQQPATHGIQLLDHLEQFRWRVLQDALQEATAAYWERRAETFAAVGNDRCDTTARNCRFHAQLLRDNGLDHQATAVINQITREHGQVA
jgi:hypothetical protein